MLAVPGWLPVWETVVLGSLLVALLVLSHFDRDRGWGRRRRERLLLGLPWGTLVSLLLVLGVYLLVQGGHGNWSDPLTIPFRSWSYLYPLGVLLAPFSHGGPGHLVGNLTSGLVLGSLAEYAWGHYPTERGQSSFSGPSRNPYARAFLFFPAGVVIVGLFTSLFSWGPIIGFSGVVFAFAGFSLARYPLATVLVLVAENLLGLLVAVLRSPVITAEAQPQYVTPWWAGIAVQGHLLGLFLGLVAAALVLDRTDRPPLSRLFLGTLLVGSSFSLWILWWYRGGERYVLYQGAGTALLVAVALLVTLGLRERWANGTRLDVPRKRIGLLLLVFPILVIGFVAVPTNLVTVDDPTPPGDGPGVEIGDYTIVYAENVTDEMVSVVNVSLLGETTQVQTSGVIVISEDRHIWTQAISNGRLAFEGDDRVVVGGLGWRESVAVARRGWTVTGNGTTYAVWLRPPGGNYTVAYTAPPAVAEPVIDGRRVAIAPGSGGFVAQVRLNNSTLATAPVPTGNGSVNLGGLTLTRVNETVVARANETRLTIATRETYPGRR